MNTSATLLDQIVPTYDASSRHTIQVAAEPARVYQTARGMDLGSPWLVRVLMGLRYLPALVAWALRHGLRQTDQTNARHSVARATFTLVAETPGEEFVLGMMGRFWTPSGGLVATRADDFRREPPDGLAQGVWNFRVTPKGNGAELSTETRVRCSDGPTRRHFLRYWRFIRIGSGLIRGSMLRRIRKEAERHES